MTTLFRAALLALPFLPAGPAAAAEYAILIWETPTDLALRADKGPEGQAYWAAYAEFGAALAKAGAARGGAPLVPGTNVAFRGAERSEGAVAAGPLALGGYFVIEAESREIAEKIAAMAPSALRGGAAELVETAPMAPAQ